MKQLEKKQKNYWIRKRIEFCVLVTIGLLLLVMLSFKVTPLLVTRDITSLDIFASSLGMLLILLTGLMIVMLCLMPSSKEVYNSSFIFENKIIAKILSYFNISNFFRDDILISD